MAKCERNGDAVLESNHVKVALVIEDAEPELRLLLREPRRTDKVVGVWTRHSLDGDLAGLIEPTRIGRAVVPVSLRQQAQVRPATRSR